MKRRVRNVLADSHIAAITIAVLLLWSVDWVFQAIWGPFARLAEYLITAVAIMGIPFAGPIHGADGIMLFVTTSYLFSASVSFTAAWLLARWVYGEGPIRSLSRYNPTILRKSDA